MRSPVLAIPRDLKTRLCYVMALTVVQSTTRPTPEWIDLIQNLPAELQLKIASYVEDLDTLRVAYPTVSVWNACDLHVLHRLTWADSPRFMIRIQQVVHDLNYLTSEQIDFFLLYLQETYTYPTLHVYDILRLLARHWHLPKALKMIQHFTDVYEYDDATMRLDVFDDCYTLPVHRNLDPSKRYNEGVLVGIDEFHALVDLNHLNPTDYYDEDEDDYVEDYQGMFLDICDKYEQDRWFESEGFTKEELITQLLYYPVPMTDPYKSFERLLEYYEAKYITIGLLRMFVQHLDIDINCYSIDTRSIRRLKTLMQLGLKVPTKDDGGYTFFGFLDTDSPGDDASVRELGDFLDVLLFLLPFREWPEAYLFCMKSWQIPLFIERGMIPTATCLLHMVASTNSSCLRLLQDWLVMYPFLKWKLAQESWHTDLLAVYLAPRIHNMLGYVTRIHCEWIEYLVDNAEELSIRLDRLEKIDQVLEKVRDYRLSRAR